MLHTLRRRQWLPRGLRETFAFFERPENLPRITPPWLAFRVVTPPPIPMRRGATIDYRVRVLGWPRRWRAVISEYDPPFSFRDEQVIGPYRRWDHRHLFSEADGGTMIEDVVTYEPPFGPLGTLLDRLVIRRQLRDIFDYRRREIERLLLEGVPS